MSLREGLVLKFHLQIIAIVGNLSISKQESSPYRNAKTLTSRNRVTVRCARHWCPPPPFFRAFNLMGLRNFEKNCHHSIVMRPHKA